MSRFTFTKFKKRETIYFGLFIIAALSASVILSAMAAERAGMYWIGMDLHDTSEKATNSRGFLMVDVSDLSAVSTSVQSQNSDMEVVPIGIGPLPSVPTLTTEELKLYGVLSRGDGLILSEDKEALIGDICWQEVILDQGETISSVADEYGVKVEDIRRANGLKPNENPKYTDILYVPDNAESVPMTLAYVNKLKKYEADLEKQGKPLQLTEYAVKDGDSLWSIANKFDLDLDTIIGSNKISNINYVKPGTVLRIPNQDGIFVKVSRNDTVAKLADKYGSYKQAVYVANLMSDKESLKIGNEIFLPGGKVAAVTVSESRRVRTRVARTTVTASSRKFRWPVMGKISSVFGWRRSPFGRRRVFHAGLDIRAPRGRGIVAAGDGRVVYSGWMSGYGKAIVISHPGGMSTLYGRCSSLLVRKGTIVRSGQLIARVGSTGRSTGNHLHFEVRINGSP
ncbi:MAG: peptidoglycan DD-metalloendopeptidase family protein, partial [Synergistaceae bacterium]|nr:peptidoglycan DD-metalloendopeptidase family protein [Synergistaceae bacterium]